MKFNRAAVVASIILLIVTGIAVWVVFRYVAVEQRRDLQGWEQRLGIIAESQKRSIESWLQKQSQQMQTLAANPLVQIYVTEINQFQSSDITESQRGQLHYLRNLLNASAQSSDLFTPVKPVADNRAQTINDGLAILNRKDVLLSTRYFPRKDALVMRQAKRAIEAGATVVSTIYSNQASQPRFIIATPVRSVQSMKADDYRGAVVAVINPDRSLYKMLRRHWLTTNTDKSMLVVKHKASIMYISPLSGRYRVFYQHPITETGNAASFGVNNIGGFALTKDYKNISVLVTSRKINHTDWVLIQKINAGEALREARSHQHFILIILLLVIVFITISFIAIWRHASSIHLQKMTDRLMARTALLDAVSGNIRDLIFLLDRNEKLVMVNLALADFLEVNPLDVKGKALNHLYDVDTSRRLLAIKHDDVRNQQMRLEINNKRYDYHITVVALKEGDYKHSHLYVLHDITDLKDAQGRHNRLMEAIIQTLVALVDKHDPYCIHHSERTREVAIAIAREMQLPQAQINTLALAALLANVGKLLISNDILTSVEPLTTSSAELLRKNNQYTIDILEGLSFEGPVLDIVKQKNEFLDGSGYPEGVSGDGILLESRILAVANAFVAMASSRAYRPGKPLKDVLDSLFAQADTHYDRRVVATLLYVVENRKDWVQWKDINSTFNDT